MSEIPVVDLIVAKACSNTSMFFWCCLMCRRWIVFRKASFKIRRMTEGESNFSSSSAFKLRFLLRLSSSVRARLFSLTIMTRCVSSSRSRSFRSRCSCETLFLNWRRSFSSCFFRALMRNCRSSCSLRCASESRWSWETLSLLSLISPWSFLKTWFICNRSLLVASIFERTSVLSCCRLFSCAMALANLCSSFCTFLALLDSGPALSSAPLPVALFPEAPLASAPPALGLWTFSLCSARIRATSSSSLFSRRFSSSNFRVVDSISLCMRCRWSWR
mmetsp:Transcript_100697/g.260088  ORF Transcript_100697/g.260088 Transcript_100697/m.260088 type:complete len:275 (-) Transcript_100697:180-1004(-)